jgi:DNA repair exonuclease SbcCD ATPase subunit
MIAVCSCLHLDGERLGIQGYWLDKALSRMKADGVKVILCAGDVFDRYRVGDKSAPTSAIVSSFRRIVESYKIPIFLVPGNHDVAPVPHPPATHLISGCPYLLDVSEFDAFPLYGLGIVGVGWSWMSKFANPQELHEALSLRVATARRLSENVIVFGHMDLSDAVFDSGRPAGSERPWPTPTSKDLADSVPADSFYLGHIHNKQVLHLDSDRRVLYVGSLWRRNWGEANNQDGWIYLDSRGRLKESIDLNGPRFLTAEHQHQVPAIGEQRMGDRLRAYEGLSLPSAQEGVTIEVITPPDASLISKAVLQREDKGLHPNMTIPQMLETWLKSQNVDPNLVKTCLQEVGGLTQEQQLGGSSMNVNLVSRVEVSGSWAGELSADFSPGWNTLLASIGKGKTTILEAPFAALFGSWPSPGRGRFKTGFPGDTGRVWVEFHAQGQGYGVERLTESSLTLYRMLAGSKSRIEGPHPSKSSSVITKLVGSAHDWERVALLVQGGAGDLVDGTDASRSEALRKILNLDELEQIRKASSDLLKNLNRKADLHKSLIAKSVELKAKAKALETEQGESYQTILASKEKFRQLNEKHGTLKVLLAHSEALALVQRAQDELKAFADPAIPGMDVEQLDRDLGYLQGQLMAAQTEMTEKRLLLSKSSQVESLKNALSRVGCAANLLPCPLIDRTVSELEQAEDAREKMAARTWMDDATYLDLQRSSDAKRIEYSRATSALQQYQAQNARKAVLEERVTQAESRASEVGHIVADIPKQHVTLEMVNQLEREASMARTIYQGAEKQFDFLHGSIVSTQSMTTSLQVEIDALTADTQRVSSLELVEKAFGRRGIPRELVAGALPAIQTEVDRLCQEFFPWMAVQLSAGMVDEQGREKDELVVFMSRSGGPLADARARSGGERGVVRLILRAALSRWLFTDGVGRVIFLDEPTSYMGPDDTEAVAKLLQSIVGAGKPYAQGVLSTHDEDLALMIGGKICRVGS